MKGVRVATGGPKTYMLPVVVELARRIDVPTLKTLEPEVSVTTEQCRKPLVLGAGLHRIPR